jgi:hypothetical protein
MSFKTPSSRYRTFENFFWLILPSRHLFMGAAMFALAAIFYRKEGSVSTQMQIFKIAKETLAVLKRLHDLEWGKLENKTHKPGILAQCAEEIRLVRR